ISGGHEADLLRISIEEGEAKARETVANGNMTAAEGAFYEKNARGLGELGIGLNPSATISGNMLEDEKAFHTCHFAIGSNYDNDADSPIHLDCLVKNPTIEVKYPNGTSVVIEKDGILAPEYGDV
ncbi:MAG TPA: peptidase M17, partial [Treponemataceae bacterium]|nr:peptidase M17 [Treponemataceae bacterium]